MEKIITINTKKTASDTALVELSPGNALDTVDPSISIDKWSFVIVFFLARLDPYLIFQIAIIIALFIYLLFFFQNAFYLVPCFGDYGRQEITTHLTST